MQANTGLGTLSESGVVINKLTKDLKWVERRLMVEEESGALKVSTQKLLAPETHIPLDSITYVQVGAEELQEQHRDLHEPLKTMNNSPAGLYISAGEASVRIRLPDEESAASLAVEIRALMQSAREGFLTRRVSTDDAASGGVEMPQIESKGRAVEAVDEACNDERFDSIALIPTTDGRAAQGLNDGGVEDVAIDARVGTIVDEGVQPLRRARVSSIWYQTASEGRSRHESASDNISFDSFLNEREAEYSSQSQNPMLSGGGAGFEQQPEEVIRDSDADGFIFEIGLRSAAISIAAADTLRDSDSAGSTDSS
jgi:hypothetical protein